MDKKAQLLKGVREIYNKMSWLNEYEMKDDRFEDYKSSEVHCLECIGLQPDCNVTKLAQAFYMTRGAISKMTKKLIAKGAIVSYQKPENKKEVYFRLTEQGQKIFRVHEEMHKAFEKRDKPVFDPVTDAEFDVMLRLVERYSTHLDAEIKKQGLEIK